MTLNYQTCSIKGPIITPGCVMFLLLLFLDIGMKITLEMGRGNFERVSVCQEKSLREY
uniref:Uncharacterized protein n=1 Tax=Rhizophagus irregularis (strain DAOM 181602 / DAOM 197198 / MUCL 43194) TaxID=747089 RepID=U9TPL7_RHIID